MGGAQGISFPSMGDIPLQLSAVLGLHQTGIIASTLGTLMGFLVVSVVLAQWLRLPH